jgi:prepilin-type processing-associated H-X9-DG protein
MFVCPSHVPGGWAPTNYTSQIDPARPNLPARIVNSPPGQVSQDTSGPNGTGGFDDQQAPRLSYIANEVLMPRKKFSSAYDAANPAGANTASLCQVSADEIDGAGNTIMLGEFSESSNGIWGSSVGGGAAYKSHRPTNGIKSSQANNVFDGETYTPGTTIAKLSFLEAEAAINAVKADKAAAPTSHHISYLNMSAHGMNGNNYTFADGHAAKATLKATLDPGNYMWGRKVYSCVDKPEIQDNP